MGSLRLVSSRGVAALIAVSMGGCETGAVGIEDCRTIEQARCQAAVNCDVGLAAHEVDICVHYAHDHCLHGMRVSDPGKNSVDKCVAAIRAAGACAEDDPDQLANTCESKLALESDTTVCQIINQPEVATDCAFLDPPDEDEDDEDDEDPDAEAPNAEPDSGAPDGG